MTDSGNGLTPGKRERLAAGACEVIHQQGVEKTTIADIAQAADVPVGNVYYYYKTKDDLVAAAIATPKTFEQCSTRSNATAPPKHDPRRSSGP
jgi:AcrR family transcriptional regulator